MGYVHKSNGSSSKLGKVLGHVSGGESLDSRSDHGSHVSGELRLTHGTEYMDRKYVGRLSLHRFDVALDYSLF